MTKSILTLTFNWRSNLTFLFVSNTLQTHILAKLRHYKSFKYDKVWFDFDLELKVKYNIYNGLHIHGVLFVSNPLQMLIETRYSATRHLRMTKCSLTHSDLQRTYIDTTVSDWVGALCEGHCLLLLPTSQKHCRPKVANCIGQQLTKCSSGG